MNLLGIDVPLWAFLLLALLYTFYKYLTWHFDDLTKIGVRGPRPIPFFGNSLTLFTKGLVGQQAELIQKYGKVCGYYLGRTPTMLVADRDMLREILVKSFDCFQNRRPQPAVSVAPPANKMLTVLKDDHWKHVRHMLSPTFSALKLRKMNSLINHAGQVLVKNLLAKAEKDESVEFKETASSFTMDVIGSTGFGIMVDSQSEPDNQFIKMANKAIHFTLSPKLVLVVLAPGLFKYGKRFGLTIFDEDVRKFFVDMSRKAMEARDSGEKRTDILQLMMDARSDDIDDNTDIGGVGGDVSHLAVDETGVWDKKGLTEDEIIGQCVLFFLSGYTTTSGMISFLIYNLAVNPDCQDTLIEEIDRVMQGHPEPTYDLVHQMPYLDMCLNESLRIYPQTPIIERECQKDITINGQFIPNEMVVAIPISVLHHDPEVWPEPKVFKPERFSPEEKAARDPLCHMPFGYGPRSCIAMRLALFECKMCLVHILQNFRLVTCAETQIPLELHKLRGSPLKGIHLKLDKRR